MYLLLTLIRVFLWTIFIHQQSTTQADVSQLLWQGHSRDFTLGGHRSWAPFCSDTRSVHTRCTMKTNPAVEQHKYVRGIRQEEKVYRGND